MKYLLLLSILFLSCSKEEAVLPPIESNCICVTQTIQISVIGREIVQGSSDPYNAKCSNNGKISREQYNQDNELIGFNRISCN